MRAEPAYPYDAVGGGCFITGRYEFAAGEKCLVLDVDLDSLPTYGQLCLSERAIRCMLVELGWDLMTPEMSAHVDQLTTQRDELRAQLDELSAAMAGMVDVPAVKAALDVVARRVNHKPDVQAWIDTLPKAETRR